MPTLYNNEAKELREKILFNVKLGLLVYYVWLLGGLGFSFTIKFFVIMCGILPGVCVMFYVMGAYSFYKPKERFIPHRTFLERARRYDANPEAHRERSIGKIIDESRRRKAWEKDTEISKMQREAMAPEPKMGAELEGLSEEELIARLTD